MTPPSVTIPPPGPVPITAETDQARARGPKSIECPKSAAAVPSLRYVTGLPVRFPRMSNPAQFPCTKFVEPRALSTLGACRPWRVESHDRHVRELNARLFDGDFETVYDLLEANFRSFPRSRGVLAQSLNGELFLLSQ